MDFLDYIESKRKDYTDWDEYIKNDQELCFYMKSVWDYQQSKIDQLEKDKQALVCYSRQLIDMLCRMCQSRDECNQCNVARIEKSIEELLNE